MARALVTGAASGLGLAVARALLAAGFDVLATDKDAAALRARVLAGVADPGGRLTTAPLDLREPGQIEAVCRPLRATGLDVLVNNAGYAVFGAQADTDLGAVSALFDTNVLGTLRVTRALLPALQQRGGTIVQLSSIAGRLVLAESGFYAATKFALEALSEALAIENAPFGVRVVVVEPGAFDTGFSDRARMASPPRPEGGAHKPWHAVWDARRDALLSAPQDPDRVAEAVLASLADPRPFLRVRVGDDAHRLLAARDALGDDPWVRLMAVRHGGEDPAFPPPADVTAAGPAAPTRFPLAAIAARHGLLDHWGTSAEAEAARALLRG
jgi:NAD(P)-dependent dehydrogenase (short-subunit alcohol dehydrogenase family)